LDFFGPRPGAGDEPPLHFFLPAWMEFAKPILETGRRLARRWEAITIGFDAAPAF
jgi:hypothetical protein